MPQKKMILFLFFSFILMFNAVQAQSLEELIQEGDSLRDAFKESEALVVFNKILDQAPQNYDALWSKSLLLARLGYREKDSKKRDELYRSAKEFAQKALDVNDTDTQSNFAMAVAMGRIALIAGTKEKVAASRDIKKFADAAIAANPNNAGAWHVLSRWHHNVANLNFAAKAAANMLFGGIPDGASDDLAVSTMQKAIELSPNFIIYRRDYANLLVDLKRKKEALEQAKIAVDLPVLTLDDPKYQDEMQKLIKKLQ